MSGVASRSERPTGEFLATVRLAVRSPEIRSALRSAITSTEGLRLAEPRSLSELLDQPRDAVADVQCVITDTVGEDGGSFVDAVRETGFDGPLLVVGDPTDESVTGSIAAGATDVLPSGIATWPRPVLATRLRGYVDVCQTIHERERTLRALHQATRELMNAETETEIAGLAADAAGRILGFPGTGVRFYDPERGALVNVSFDGDAADAIDSRPPLPIEDTPHGEAFRTGRTVIHDVAADGGPYDLGPFERTMYVPIGDHGVLSVGRRDAAEFDATDVKYAEVLAANVTAALDRADRERLLRQRERRLQQERDRLEEFASAVAHDLRNPLNVAQGYLEDIETDSQGFDRVRTALSRMERLITDVLTLTRKGDAVEAPATVDLEQVVRNAWDVVATREATLEVPDELGTLEADRERLQAVCENLFQNTIDHAGETARVRVGRLDDGTGWYVADDGSGVPTGNRDRVFERGYSNTPAGTGFGLAIVDRVADAHGWEVSLGESWADGARFEFRIE